MVDEPGKSVDREACKRCALGMVSGEGDGQFCPFIDRRYRAGDVIYRAGERADYVWFVKSGSVALERGNGQVYDRSSPGSFVGLECMIRERYDATARVATDATLCGATREGMANWLGVSSERTCFLLRDLLRDPGSSQTDAPDTDAQASDPTDEPV